MSARLKTLNSEPCAGGHRDLRALQRLFEAQDGRRLGQLVRGMSGLKGGEAVFEAWMKQQSDTVQVRGSMEQRSAQEIQSCVQGIDRAAVGHCADEGQAAAWQGAVAT